MKKFLCLLLAVALLGSVFTIAPLTARAEAAGTTTTEWSPETATYAKVVATSGYCGPAAGIFSDLDFTNSEDIEYLEGVRCKRVSFVVYNANSKPVEVSLGAYWGSSVYIEKTTTTENKYEYVNVTYQISSFQRAQNGVRVSSQSTSLITMLVPEYCVVANNTLSHSTTDELNEDDKTNIKNGIWYGSISNNGTNKYQRDYKNLALRINCDDLTQGVYFGVINSSYQSIIDKLATTTGKIGSNVNFSAATSDELSDSMSKFITADLACLTNVYKTTSTVDYAITKSGIFSGISFGENEEYTTLNFALYYDSSVATRYISSISTSYEYGLFGSVSDPTEQCESGTNYSMAVNYNKLLTAYNKTLTDAGNEESRIEAMDDTKYAAWSAASYQTSENFLKQTVSSETIYALSGELTVFSLKVYKHIYMVNGGPRYLKFVDNDNDGVYDEIVSEVDGKPITAQPSGANGVDWIQYTNYTIKECTYNDLALRINMLDSSDSKAIPDEAEKIYIKCLDDEKVTKNIMSSSSYTNIANFTPVPDDDILSSTSKEFYQYVKNGVFYSGLESENQYMLYFKSADIGYTKSEWTDLSEDSDAPVFKGNHSIGKVANIVNGTRNDKNTYDTLGLSLSSKAIRSIINTKEQTQYYLQFMVYIDELPLDNKQMMVNYRYNMPDSANPGKYLDKNGPAIYANLPVLTATDEDKWYKVSVVLNIEDQYNSDGNILTKIGLCDAFGNESTYYIDELYFGRLDNMQALEEDGELGSSIVGANIVLGADLEMRYYVLQSDYDVNSVMQVKRNAKNTFITSSTEITDANGDSSIQALLDEATATGRTLRYYSYNGINPQCMTDCLDAYLYYHSNLISDYTAASDDDIGKLTRVSMLRGYNVRKNVNNIVENFSGTEESKTKLYKLLGAMLNYGAAAQKVAGYYTDDLANAASLKEAVSINPYDKLSSSVPTITGSELKGVQSTTLTVNDGTTKYISSVGVELSDTVKLKFNIPATALETDSCTYSVKLGETDITTDCTRSDDYVYTSGILPTDFDTVFTVEIYNGDTLVNTLKYSVNTYLYNKGYGAKAFGTDTTANANKLALVKALAVYGYCAENY